MTLMRSDEEIDGAVGIFKARVRAEDQLLSLVREEDSDGFTLTISFTDGRWTVSTEDLDAGTSARGRGDSFAEAWHTQDPQWPKQTAPDAPDS
jgi:hypothetical protein